MNIVYIMRGIPGSGKTTKAKEIIQTGGGIIYSTDHYFVGPDGYLFNPKMLGENHNRNFRAFKDGLVRKVSQLVVDNCNIMKCDYKHYEEAAYNHGYKVEIISLPLMSATEAAKRTVHHVPTERIQMMIDRFQS